ncbi:hypothetical protein SAMN04515674_12313 [Pseudarcicella hirudinis]|uniref:CDP-Glycerol:Poly(Glycerophosphate) glycerophosphotransferase n=1 Tax=Pseudarcicella hirudinis TaxID=1079859 RepID=A0A1I5YZZ5_9BACT|nr:hypothetical protein [Pseudarcicella hirudinis]SFQ49769.1 hypothetical protein SAMN04515674_12313 [Pseudarcicella hirudinis]
MGRKILFITGSMNQTSQMHQIAQELTDFDCWFSQIFADSPLINALIKYTPFIDSTILAGQFRANSEKYIREHNLQMDYMAQKNRYDLVVYCSDLIIPDRMLQNKTLWVQEGMVDGYTWKSKWVKNLHFPPYFSGDTSLNGASNICDIYCAASDGYKDYFVKRGTNVSKILVTGIPNYDNIRQFLKNDFPYHNYVMVATSDIRETFRKEDRIGFIKKATEIAAGRRLLFKLHPNEIYDRAVSEIKEHTPADTLIFQSGSTNDMIANCEELITQYSTVVYVGMALGKKVHSYFDLEELYRLNPIQNAGTSAQNIANICRSFVNFDGKKEDFLKQFQYQPMPIDVHYA